MAQITQLINIQGMHCDACKKLVHKRISQIERVGSIEVDICAGLVQVISNRVLEVIEVQKVLTGTEYQVTRVSVQ